MPRDIDIYLQPSACIDSDHTAVRKLSSSLVTPDLSDIENAVSLYYWVRDAVRYNPYTIGDTRECLRASHTLEAGEAWCVPKAVLLAALCRAAGIAARVGFADVRNHLSTARMRETMQGDTFYFHGYCSIYLNGRWVKSTPAFNIELCEKFGLKPLEFDGLNDSLYHAFDAAGSKHMEYLHDRGEYVDVPFDEMMEIFRQNYPSLFQTAAGQDQPSSGEALLEKSLWEGDVAQEVAP